MIYQLNPPLTPRNGHTLRVVIVARISGCTNQKEMSLDDQADHCREYITDRYDGMVDYQNIATTAKGEWLDRAELGDIERLIRTRTFDVVVAEDGGRMIRSVVLNTLCGIAVDHGTRVLIPNDCIDTADEGWENDVIEAGKEHANHNAHTSKRIKQKMMNRFVKTGAGVPVYMIFGYAKPPGCKSFFDLQKNQDEGDIILKLIEMVKGNLNCTAAAGWLNAKGIKPAHHCKRPLWDGAMVRRLLTNTLLKGKPMRGLHTTKKIHETGHRVQVVNPAGPKFIDCPHLAYLTEADFDQLKADLVSKNRHFTSAKTGKAPRKDVPRKSTRFPGHLARCAYCGEILYWGGHGITTALICSSTFDHQCWNSVTFKGHLAADRVIEALMAQLRQWPRYDEIFARLLQDAAQSQDSASAPRLKEIDHRQQELTKEIKNVLAGLSQWGPNSVLKEQFDRVQKEEADLARERDALFATASQPIRLPSSASEIRELVEQKLKEFGRHSYEFADLMRQIVTEFTVHVVQCCDGGHPVCRAHVKVECQHLWHDIDRVPGLPDLLKIEFDVDLFKPPQRVRYLREIVRMNALKMKERAIAKKLGITQPVVQRAKKLDRLMIKLGVTDPYLRMDGPPAESRMRIHLHPSFQQILPDAPPSAA